MSKNLALETHAPAYLSVHDIHAYYGESYIVQGVSFNVHEGAKSHAGIYITLGGGGVAFKSYESQQLELSYTFYRMLHHY